MGIKESLNDIIGNGMLFKEFVQGDSNSSVLTENGLIPTLSKFASDASDKLVSSLIATSVTPITVGIGLKSFQVQAGKKFTVGQWLVAGSDTASLTGRVHSYTGATLVMNVTKTVGAGSFSNWSIGLSGPPSLNGDGSTDGVLVTQLPWEV